MSVLEIKTINITKPIADSLYLSTSGGILTGPLSGTSAYFSSDVSIDTIIVASSDVANPLPLDIIPAYFGRDGFSILGIGAFSSVDVEDSPTIIFVRGGGTHASPTKILSGYRLGSLEYQGQYDTTSGNIYIGALVSAFATENWSVTTAGSELRFATTPKLSTDPVLRWTIQDDGTLLANGAMGISSATGTGQFARLALGTTVHATDLLTLLSADTVASGNVVNISHSGSVTGSHTGIAYVGSAVASVEQIGQSITLTGLSLTNTCLKLSATGGTNNYGLIVSAGYLGFGISAPTSPVHLYRSDTSVFEVMQDNPNTGTGAFCRYYFRAGGGNVGYFGAFPANYVTTQLRGMTLVGAGTNCSIWSSTANIQLIVGAGATVAGTMITTGEFGLGKVPTAGNLLDLLQTSTTASSVGLNILHSGLVAGGLSTVYGQRISVTGANSVNIGLDFSAGVTGATTNYWIYMSANDFWLASGTLASSGAVRSPAFISADGYTAYLKGRKTDAGGIYNIAFGGFYALTPGTDRWICGFYNDANTFTVVKSRINTLGQYETLDTSAAYYVRQAFTSSSALGADRVLTFDLCNANRTIAWNATGDFYINQTSTTTLSAGLNVLHSGIIAAGTAYGVYSSVTGNGAAQTNIAGYFSATGGVTANYGLIVANGSVGIGIAAPMGKFEVETDGAFQSCLFTVYSNTASDEPAFYFRRGKGTLASPTTVIDGNILGSVRWAPQYSSTPGNVNTSAKIEAVARGTFTVANAPTDMVFYTCPASSGTPVERMRILSSGWIGVGMTPTAQLEVIGVASGNAFRVNAGDPTYASQYTYVSQYGNLTCVGLANVASNGLFSAVGVGDTYSRFMFGLNTGSPFMGFGPGATTRDVFIYRSTTKTLKFDADLSGGAASLLLYGTVGINMTPVATNALDITQTSTTTLSTGLNVLHSGTGIAGTAQGAVISVTGTNTTNTALTLSASGATNNYGLIVTGRVGFATTTPGYAVDLQGTNPCFNIAPTTTTQIGYLRLANAGGTNFVGMENSAGNGLIAGSVAYSLTVGGAVAINLAVGGAVIANINTYGLGIGITNHTVPLHVVRAAADNAVYADDYSDTTTHTNYWFSRKSNSDTKGTLTETGTGHYLGVFHFQGVNTLSAFAYGAKIEVSQNGAAGTYIPSDIKLYTYSASAVNTNQLVLNNNSNVGIGVDPNALNKLDVLQTSTTANSTGLNILHSGLVAGGLSTVYGQRISVTGANAVNIGLDFSGGVTGATNNYWVYGSSSYYWKADGKLYANNVYTSQIGLLSAGTSPLYFLSNVNNTAGLYAFKFYNVTTLTSISDRWLVGFYLDATPSVLVSRINTLGQYETLDTSAAYYVRQAFTSSTALTADHVLTHDLYNADRTIAWDSLGAFYLTNASVTDLSKGLYVTHTGACAGGAGTGYALYASKTGASTLNVGGYFSATGATTNYGIQVNVAATVNDYILYANANTYWLGTDKLYTSQVLTGSTISCPVYWPRYANNTVKVQGTKTDGAGVVAFSLSNSGALTVGAKTVAGSDRYIAGFYNDDVTTLQAYICSNGVYGQRDGATYFGLLSFASTTALGANHMLTVDLKNLDQTLGFGINQALVHKTMTPVKSGGGSTAGTLGEIVWDATNIFVCTTGGGAGVAIWKSCAIA